MSFAYLIRTVFLSYIFIAINATTMIKGVINGAQGNDIIRVPKCILLKSSYSPHGQCSAHHSSLNQSDGVVV